MRAKKVNENINFERSGDPKQKLGIGNIFNRCYQKLSEIKDVVGGEIISNERQHDLYGKIVEWNIKWIPGSENITIGLMCRGEIESGSFIKKFEVFADIGRNPHKSLFKTTDSETEWQLILDNWIKQNILNDKSFISESNFERGRDPKESMNIGWGKYAEIINKMNNHAMNYGFKMVDIPSPDGEYEDIAAWQDSHGNTITLYADNVFLNPPELRVYVETIIESLMNGVHKYTSFLSDDEWKNIANLI